MHIQEHDCPRILVVDDDKDHCQLMEDALMYYFRMGADSLIQPVYNAADCLSQVLKSYDLVLLDLNLPDMSGLDVLNEILARADVAVIIVTGEKDLATAAEAIERGAQDYICKHGDYLLAIPAVVQKNLAIHKIKKEHDRLEMQLQWMLKELQSKNQQLEDSLLKLKQMATTDGLTGLTNRRSFNEQLVRLFDEACRYDNDLTCAMIDLDHYKALNDTLGHQMGDEVLRIVADEIRRELRTPDIAARYGGDEFVLLLPQTSLDEGLVVIERLRQTLLAAIRADLRITVPITFSIGVASCKNDEPITCDALVMLADRALYCSKELGRDRVVAYRDMRKETMRRICRTGQEPAPRLPIWLK